MKPDRIIAVRNDKTIYRDGERCLKVFCQQYSKADVFHEALNQARVEETGLPIPPILQLKQIDGKWALISQYIKGKSLSRLMKEQPQRTEEFLDWMIDLQCRIHRQVCPALESMKDKLNRDIGRSGLEATRRYDLHSMLEQMPRHRKLCHGDFNPSNIMVREDGTLFLLDWSHAGQGNASSDAARACLWFRLHGNEEGEKAYLERFCQKSGTAKEYVERWMPIVMAAQLVHAKESEREQLFIWLKEAEV